MSMAPGTKPFIKNWAELNPLTVATVMARYCKAYKTLAHEQVVNNYAQIIDAQSKKTVVRIYKHRRSHQVLLRADLVHLIPKEANIVVTVKSKP